jgi:energy-coupling factor transporter ATP-binding protein EcfA2
MLKTLEIENMRGIRKGTISDFSRINILIGPNGCGKSTVLESLVLLATPFSGKDPIEGNSRDHLMAQKRNANSIYQSQIWHLDSSRLSCKATFDFGHIQYSMLKPSGIEFSPRPSAGNNNNRDICGYMDRLLFVDSTLALKRNVEQVLWERAFMSKLHKELLRHWSSTFGRNVESISYTPDKMLVDCEPGPLYLDSHGAGMRIAFRILLAAVVSDGSLLLLEEFDNYQHKTSMERLAAALCEIAEQHKTQIIMTTHSLESVHAFVAAAKLLNKDLVRIFPLELDASGTLTTRGLKSDNAANLMASGLDLRELTSYAK